MTHAHNERRPAVAAADLRGSRAAAKPNKTHGKSTTDAPLAPLLQPWAEVLIGRATGPVPQYGSAEWEALPDNDSRRVAACVIAAEAWRTFWSPKEHERRLRTEIEAAHLIEEEPRWTPEIVAQVHRSANRPSFAELSERRGEPEAAARGRAHQRRLGLVPSG